MAEAINKIKNSFYKKVSNYFILTMNFLNRKHLKIIKRLDNQSNDNPNKYEVLSPRDNVHIDKYSEMLQVALNTSGVNNIAITGSYGSGKSSFLRTFEKKHAEWNYLHISLATFEESNNIEKDESGNIKPTKTIQEQDNQHKLIERSILQQIFYKERDKVIPFSRFKRITNIKKSSLILHSILLFILISYSLSMFYPCEVGKLINYNLTLKFEEHFLLSLIVIALFGFYFYKAIKYFTKLKISKFNIKSGEFQIGNKDDSSILNEHLDEILYFFEVTSYNIVVLEDLDRFNSTEIFIKLRELNILVNNSKDINRRIIFIYAIRDDMFKNKDRTKFFEFIVPIIPYIDCSTFTHEHLFIFLKVCAHLKHNSKINIIYTSVEDYLLDEDNGWLSKGTKEIRNIIGYSGNLLPSKQLHLIVLVGLENERIQKIIEEYEPNKITIGKATIKSSLNGTVSDLNEKLHNRVDKFVKKVVSNLNDTQQFEFSSNNPEETFEVLNTIINENSNYNNIIVAANSKISTLGVAKLGLLNENIQICYAEPIEYNTEHYTKGCKDFKYFEFIFND